MGDVGRVQRLIGVYDANGTVAGEIAYVVGHLLGLRHCALCDITHGSLRRKPAFDGLRARLPVPFEVVHLDERSDEVRAATAGQVPCVVAAVDGDWIVVLDAAALEAMAGSVDALEDALRREWEARGFTPLW